MKKLTAKLITKLKGKEFTIDPSYPNGYVLGITFRRAAMLVRGLFVRCKKQGFLFVGGRTTIKGRRRLHTGANVTIERNCYLDAMSAEGLRLGNNTSVGKFTTIECSGSLQHRAVGMRVGDNVGLGSHGFFGCAGGITIGSDTIFGNYVSMHSENHVFADRSTPIRLQGVTHKGISIGSDCWIGAKATILDGAHIGNGCIIAAGSVVVAGQYTDYGIYGGIPAKWIKER